MKYMNMLKKRENVHSDALQKLQKDLFTVNAVPQGACISKKKPSDDYFDCHARDAIAELNRRGISIMDYPPATRHRALELEESMTRAANAEDQRAFLEYLRQWRECFN